MAAITLYDLRVKAREYANMERSGFVNDSEFNKYINDGLKEYYDLLISTYGDEYFEATKTFTVSAGKQEYNFADDVGAPFFYKMITLAVVVNTNYFYPIKKLDTFEKAYRNFTNPYTGKMQLRYVPLCPTITEIWEVDKLYRRSEVVSYLGDFYKSNSEHSSPTFIGGDFTIIVGGNFVTEFNFENGWDKYVTLNASIDALDKEESYEQSATLGKKLAKIGKRIDILKTRDLGQPQSIIDIQARASVYGELGYFIAAERLSLTNLFEPGWEPYL
jgi:hypothetical protein